MRQGESHPRGCVVLRFLRLAGESCLRFWRSIRFRRRQGGFLRGFLLAHKFLLEFTLGAAQDAEAFAEIAGDFRQARSAEDDEANDGENEPLRRRTEVRKRKHGRILPRMRPCVKRSQSEQLVFPHFGLFSWRNFG